MLSGCHKSVITGDILRILRDLGVVLGFMETVLELEQAPFWFYKIVCIGLCCFS